MTGLRDALATELRKARRSRVPWLVAAAFTAMPLVVGLFMIILKDPGTARKLGLLGTKAQLAAGTADWPTALSMLGQAMAVGGAVLFAFLTSWVYGREFADRTIRGLLAIPTARVSIVVAKSIVVAGWGVAIGAWVIVAGFAVCALVGLPGWSADRALDAVLGMAAAVVLTLVLQPVTGLVASVGRGYLAGLAWAVLTIAMAQVLAVLGLGPLFPWAVPALASGAGGPELGVLPPASIVAVLVTGVLGLVATAAWWTRADQVA